MKKHSEYVFTKTIGPTFIFKATNFHHSLCPSSSKCPRDPIKKVGFAFFALHWNKMLVELCVEHYATYDGCVNGVDNIFKHLQHGNDIDRSQ